MKEKDTTMPMHKEGMHREGMTTHMGKKGEVKGTPVGDCKTKC